MISGEGLEPRDGKGFAGGLEGGFRRQTLLVRRAVGADVELILRLLVEVRQGDGLRGEERCGAPVGLVAFLDEQVLVLRCLALPGEGGLMSLQSAQHDARGVLAARRTAQRHAAHVIQIDSTRLTGLVKTDIDRAAYVSGEIYRVGLPFGFPELVGCVAFGLGSIIGVNHLKRSRLRAAEGDLYTQFAGRGVVADACLKTQALSGSGFELRSDEPVFGTCHFLDLHAVLLELSRFLPSVSGVSVNSRPSLRRESLILKALVELLSVQTCAEQGCKQ